MWSCKTDHHRLQNNSQSKLVQSTLLGSGLMFWKGSSVYIFAVGPVILNLDVNFSKNNVHLISVGPNHGFSVALRLCLGLILPAWWLKPHTKAHILKIQCKWRSRSRGFQECLDDLWTQCNVCKVVRSKVCATPNQGCTANTSSVVLRESEIHHAFWHEENSSFLKHDAIPTIFQASGKSKKVR